ncbi:conserved hypothetical protein [Chloroherpeton thalassium ATCC 35110]|uniref:Uracil-DNA glycosylase-like domain-containing protein n=1 Tax=Chloroherpeton thalassium (strain ATCC 35110 / GB-78) TaxID=517418 RepID=B3QT41_CHLT3|nr:uracil-DNA glycosylase family protein [Chloroherpeton thalassium]ACF14140.1 conserved hypothetical protein [Chloroherpeton thalassium ATCC 35110]
MTFGEKALSFFKTISLDANLLGEVEVMNPYQDLAVLACVQAFFEKYYDDFQKRIFVWGINPGRHGGGVTGIPFTDPFALSEFLGISHSLAGQRELSSQFIYQFIAHFGGASAFYQKFYINSLSPLGFIQNGKNYNFYDNATLQNKLTPFIEKSISSQMAFGAERRVTILLGTGKLLKFFERLNAKHLFFERVLAVEHPRFVMQYKRKSLDQFLEKYAQTFREALAFVE